MTFTFRQLAIGWAIHLALGPMALAVMPPYTSYPGSETRPCATTEKSQDVSNQEVIQALMENRKLLEELLQRLDQTAPSTKVSTEKSKQGE
jgi:hypothetical protein